MREKLKGVKLYLGPMSKNIVDGVIAYVNDTGANIGFVASQNQIGYGHKRGYVNNWSANEFVKYVRSKCKMVLCRDHAQFGHGNEFRQDVHSFGHDCDLFDVVHIDPFKTNNFSDSRILTCELLKFGCDTSGRSMFEIGTEEAVLPYSAIELEKLLFSVKTTLGQAMERVAYAVIQAGTRLDRGINVGKFDADRFSKMQEVCLHYGVMSKEHNGDYLDPSVITKRFDAGLSAINIAPMLAQFESNIILDLIRPEQMAKWVELMSRDGNWRRWFPKVESIDAINSPVILSVAGHYVFSHPEFISVIDLNSISDDVRVAIGEFLDKILVSNNGKVCPMSTENRPKTLFIDIDGVLINHDGIGIKQANKPAVVLPGVIEKLDEWDRKGYRIILTTGRRESERESTKSQLRKVGIIFDELIMGIGGGERVLINDLKPNSEIPTASAICIKRNSGIKDLMV